MIWNAQVGPWRQSRQTTRKALQPLTKILPTLSGFKTQRRSIKPFANDNTRIPARGAGHSWLKLNRNVVCRVQCCWAVQCFYREGVHYEIRQHAVSRVSKSTLDIWRHSEGTPASQANHSLQQREATPVGNKFQSTHTVAKHQLLFALYPILYELDQAKSSDVGPTYDNGKACRNFVGYIAQDIKNKIVISEKQSKFLSFTCDGTTDYEGDDYESFLVFALIPSWCFRRGSSVCWQGWVIIFSRQLWFHYRHTVHTWSWGSFQNRTFRILCWWCEQHAKFVSSVIE